MNAARTDLSPTDAEALVAFAEGGPYPGGSLPADIVATLVRFSPVGTRWAIVSGGHLVEAEDGPIESVDEVRIFTRDQEWHCVTDGGIRGWHTRSGAGAEGFDVIERRLLLKGADNRITGIHTTDTTVVWSCPGGGSEVHVIATPSGAVEEPPSHLVVHQLIVPDDDGVQRVIAERFVEVV